MIPNNYSHQIPEFWRVFFTILWHFWHVVCSRLTRRKRLKFNYDINTRFYNPSVGTSGTLKNTKSGFVCFFIRKKTSTSCNPYGHGLICTHGVSLNTPCTSPQLFTFYIIIIRKTFLRRCKTPPRSLYSPAINYRTNMSWNCTAYFSDARALLLTERVIVLCVYAAHACSFNCWSDYSTVIVKPINTIIWSLWSYDVLQNLHPSHDVVFFQSPLFFNITEYKMWCTLRFCVVKLKGRLTFRVKLQEA